MTVGPHLLGRVPSTYDERDHILAVHYSKLLTAAVIPAAVKAPTTSHPKDQGETPRCVGYSGEYGRLITELPDLHHVVRFDPDDLYDRCKEIDGSPGSDGTSLRAAITVLQGQGALVMKASATSGVKVGRRLKIKGYARLRTRDEVKAALTNLRHAWFGLPWYNSWFRPANGNLPAPDSEAGGHAILAVGYDDTHINLDGTLGAFLLANSWGTSWGIKGRVWLPYEYVNLSDTNMSWEAWSTTDIKGDI